MSGDRRRTRGGEQETREWRQGEGTCTTYYIGWMRLNFWVSPVPVVYTIPQIGQNTKKEPMRSSLSLSFVSLLLFYMLYYLNSGAVFMTNHCTGSIGTKSVAFSLASSDQVTFFGCLDPSPLSAPMASSVFPGIFMGITA